MHKTILLLFILFSYKGFCQQGTDSLCPLTPSLIPVKAGNKWGYLNRDLKLVIRPRFESAEPFDDIFYEETIISQGDHYATVKYKGNYHRIDSTGKIITTLDSLKILNPSISMRWKPPGYNVVYINGKYGVTGTEQGEQIIEPVYDLITPFDQSRMVWLPFLVQQNGKYGVVNTSGRIIIPVLYDEIKETFWCWSNIGLVYARKGNEWFYVDYCGTEYRIP